MWILSKYILKNHIAPFLFGSLTVIFLFLFQFILKSIDQLVGKGLTYWVIIKLISLNLAWMIVLAVPMGVLFSTLMAFGAMSASHEITIVKASGGSLLKMMAPVIFMGILLTYGLYWFNDAVLPEANHQEKTLMGDIQRKKPTFAIEAGQFSNQIDGYTILSRKVNQITGLLQGVTIYDNSRSQNANIISADTGFIEFSKDYSKMIITLFNGEIHQFIPGFVKNYKKINFENYQINLNASGFLLERSDSKMVSRSDREMRIADMQKVVNEANLQANKIKEQINTKLNRDIDYIIGNSNTFINVQKEFADNSMDTSNTTELLNFKKRVAYLSATINPELIRIEDFDTRAREYTVEIQKKYAIPFACFIFVFIGCPLGIITKGGNFGISAAISLAFYIFYWACLIGGEKLADRGFISPILSMWMGNLMIGIAGLILTFKVNNESFRIPRINKILKHFKKNKF